MFVPSPVRSTARLLGAAFCLAIATAAAAPVGFDNSYGSGGKVFANLSFGASDDIAQAVAIQPNGAMVVAGTCQNDFCIARFLANGDLDPSFGIGGKVTTTVGVGANVARAVTLDGTRIVVAGSCTQGGETNFCVARYLSNGALDTTFNGTGTVITPVGLLADQAYALAMDGTKILVGGECEVAGQTDSCLVRYLGDGSLDATYGSGGKVILPFSTSLDGIRGLAVTGGQAIAAVRCLVFSEGKFCVARFNANGSLDASFGTGGVASTFLTPFGVQRFDYPNALSIMNDGRIVAAGQCRDSSFNNHMCALVLNANGTPSTAINGNGQVMLTVATTSAATATAVATVNNNAIYLSGPCTVSGVQRFCVASINGLGGLSFSFNAGQALVDALNVSVDAVPNAVAAVYDANTLNTAISVVGSCGGTFVHDFCMARYDQNGTRVNSFGVFGVKVQELTLARLNDVSESLVRQADGKILAAGTCASNRACLARFNTNGSLDTSFASGGIYLGAAGTSQGLGARVGLDGTGIVYATQGTGGLRVTRLLANGTPEPSWGGGTGTVVPALPVDVGADKIAGVAAAGGGAVIIGFSCPAGPFFINDFCLVKLAASGALDASFNAAGSLPGLRRESFGASDTAETMAMDGGSIVLAGNCRVGNNFDPCVMRFTSAGVPDTSFNGTGKLSLPMGTTNANILAISVSAGVITAGGGCTPGVKEDFCLARINANGTLDTTFNGTGMATLSLGLFASRVQGLVVDGNGVVVAGSCSTDAIGLVNDVCLARFGANGILDVNFNGSGTLRTQVGGGQDATRVTQLIQDGPRYLASLLCLPPNGDGLYDFCLAAYLQLPASLPGAPFITGVVAGDTQATVSFVPPVNNGGSAIFDYTVTCGSKSATGGGSPLTVITLLNGVSVGCTARARNSAGTGPASDPPVDVTPLKAATVTATASVNPSTPLGDVRFFASVAGQGPTGTVQFKVPGGGFVPGCVGAYPVISGVATCFNNTFSTPGTYSIYAYYSGDGANSPAVSPPLSHTVVDTFLTLTITKLGAGAGAVTSSPAGINCGTSCAANFQTNALVTLSASPSAGSVFAGWSGACTGTGSCLVRMLGPLGVTATFNLAAANPRREDMNGDGKSDILYRNFSTGQVYRMLMNGLAIVDPAIAYVEPDLAWKIVGDADFTGDGITDLLWRHDDGRIFVMPFDAAGMPMPGAVIYTEPNAAWKIVQTPDVDGDGKADIVWWNSSTGQVYVMLVNGLTLGAQGLMYAEPDTAWKIVASGDFAGSGRKNQLLWRHSTTGVVYLMTIAVSGSSFSQTGTVIYTEPDLAWKILAAADFDGDGKSDILWRNDATGQVYIMLMNGPTVTSAGIVYTEPNLVWKIVAQGDYDGDGKCDILYRNEATGQVYMMRMNGLAIASAQIVYSEPNLAWKVLGPYEYGQ